MTRFQEWQKRAALTIRSASLWSALGVLSASVIMVNLNVLCSRFYERWDVSATQSFTLSKATVELLEAVDEPIDVVVFLTRGDRLLADVRHMLEAYEAHTRQLRIRFVDPERDTAEFLALQQKFGIVAGKTDDGKLLTDTSVVLARGENRWFLTPEDLISLDAEGNVEPRLEQALTEGVAQVTQGETLKICFSEGHQEASTDDVAPHGLAELRHSLSKSNLEVSTTDLSKANLAAEHLSECKLIVVAGPKVVFAERAAHALEDYFQGGGSLLLLLDPYVAEDGRLQKSGLESVARAGGITLGGNFVIEQEAELRLPNGFGEAFLATPEEHPITEGLRHGPKIDFRVLVVGSQSLGTTQESSARPLLTSSKQSFALTDLASVERGDHQLIPLGDDSGPYYVAVASDNQGEVRGKAGAKRRRMVVTGAANLAWSRNWRDPTLLGDRLFVESAIAWLVDRPALVSVPKRRSYPAGLSVTEDSLSSVLLYVMVYMPLTAALMGAFVLFRRRKVTRDDPPENAEGSA